MEIINVLLDPLALFSLLLLSWILLQIGTFDRCRRLGFPVLLLLILMILASPAVVNPLLVMYENQTALVSCANDSSLPIVVLGGGVDGRATKSSELQYLSAASFARSIETERLAKSSPHSRVYLAGGIYRNVAESRLMGHMLVKMGVHPNRLLFDDVSRNTYENALEIRRLLKSNNENRPARLVTSAVHMLRAKAVFESAGVEVCPVPVDFQGLVNVPAFAVIPQTSALQKTADLLHELLGWGYYKASGKLQISTALQKG